MKLFSIIKVACLITALCVATYSISSATHQDQITRERLTVRWIAKTLVRLGEERLANRFMEDYFVKHRVHFRPMNSHDQNAETGYEKKSKANEVSFNSDMLFVADLDRILQKRPYGDKSQLIPWATTVLHEYQHMDQSNPQNKPKWEDPAWQNTDKSVADWSVRIEAEYGLISKLPSSKEKDARIQEIKDIVQRILSEIGGLREGIDNNEKNGSLTPGQSWRLDNTASRLKSILSTIEKKNNFDKLIPPKPPVDKKGGYWSLTQSQPFDKLAPDDVNYSLSSTDGQITCGWRLNNDVFKFTAKWTSPPKVILPTDRIKINMAISIIANSGDQYSANGSFSIWFDRPECEPGFVISPTGLKGENGEGSSIAVTHKLGVPAPKPLDVFIDGKALSTGSKGARIALMVFAGNGRNAGFRYIYEWRDNF